MIGDLRDLDGDLGVGVRTLAARLGERAGSYVVYAILLIIALQIAAMEIKGLYALLPFFIPVAYLTKMRRYRSSHKWYVYSFLCAGTFSVVAAFSSELFMF